MREPTLVIMAAGMGSRFGGLKQITPVDNLGHKIIDFSLFDAKRAGFKKIAFIIKHEIEKDFKETVGYAMEQHFEVKYIYQQLDKIPAGFTVPENRVKPWGTGHAVSCLKGEVDGPFAVINADDFYGPMAYKQIYDFLVQDMPDNRYAMVGFPLRNTLSDHGSVSRGECSVEGGLLTKVTERTKIVKKGNDAAYTEDGETWTEISGSTPVSMNFWGFRQGILTKLHEELPRFLEKNLPVNPEKCELHLPFVVDQQIQSGEATVQVLHTDDSWFGVTYPEDLPSVKASVQALKDKGMYPEKLWG